MWQANDYITEEELLEYRQAAERAWNDDTRHYLYSGNPISSSGQCYVTSKWLASHLGGFVASKSGHFFWVDPEGKTVIDLTGDQFCKDQPRIASTNDPAYRGFRVVSEQSVKSRETLVNPRAERFRKRADRELNRQDDEVYRIATDYAGDAFPGSTPQAEEDRENKAMPSPYWHDEPNKPDSSGTYQFIYANGQLHVSPDHGHDDLAQHAQVDEDHDGPIAVGFVNVDDSQATWDVHSNISIHALKKVLDHYSQSVGWQMGGINDIEGEPIGSGGEFSPSSARIPFRYIGGHLYIGKEGSRDIDLVENWLRKQTKVQNLRRHASKWLPLSINGTIEMDSYFALLRIGQLHPAFKYATEDQVKERFESFEEAIVDWATDQGVEVHVAGNDNIIKNLDFLDLHNLADPSPNAPDQHQFPASDDSNEDQVIQGVYKCQGCQKLFPNYFELKKHRNAEEGLQETEPKQNDIPENDAGETLPKHFKEEVTPGLSPISNTFVIPQPVKEARRVDGFDTYAKAWNLEDKELNHLVAYQDGSPVGFASLRDNEIVAMHEARSGVNQQIMSLLQRHYDELKSSVPTTEVADAVKQSGWVKASSDYWKWAQGQDPSQTLQDAIPFVFDVDEDAIFVGAPGQRHSDIHGNFHPGGIVEGTYEPDGHVIIRSMTDIPYSVRHMLELWYYQHPELEIKNVSMEENGEETKLTRRSIGHRVVARIAANSAAYRAATSLQKIGEVYAVGGIVRDAILGSENSDAAVLMAVASSDEVEDNLRQLPGSIQEAPAGFLYHQAYSSTLVKPTEDRDASLADQDFTLDAVAINTKNASILDPYDGIADADAGILDAVDPKELWPLRAVRMASFGLNPSEKLSQLARAKSFVYSTDALRNSLQGALKAEKPSQGIRVAHRLGVLSHMLPELDANWDFDQNTRYHRVSLGEHLCRTVDAVASQSRDTDLRMAALLHDIGKPASVWQDEEGFNHYYKNKEGQGEQHELIGARMARAALHDLEVFEDSIDKISELVRLHMWPNFRTRKGARKFLSKAGPYAEELFVLRYADMVSKGRSVSTDQLVRQRKLTHEAQAHPEMHPHKQAQLAITGHDLIQNGMQSGPKLGEVLDKLTQVVTDDPNLNYRDKLLKLAHQYAILEKE